MSVATAVGNPHAGDDLIFAHVQAAAAFVDDFPGTHLPLSPPIRFGTGAGSPNRGQLHRLLQAPVMQEGQLQTA